MINSFKINLENNIVKCTKQEESPAGNGVIYTVHGSPRHHALVSHPGSSGPGFHQADLPFPSLSPSKLRARSHAAV